MKLKENFILWLLIFTVCEVLATDDQVDPPLSEPQYNTRKDSYYVCLGENALDHERERYREKLLAEVPCSRLEKIIDPAGEGDRRSRLKNLVQSKDHQFNCYLEIYYANVEGKTRVYYGSGISIARNVVLTAGHNLYDVMDGGYPDRIDCFAGCYGNEVLADASVFPKTTPSSVYVHSKYVDLENKRKKKTKSEMEEHYVFSRYDMALIIFDKEKNAPFKDIKYVQAYKLPPEHVTTKKKFRITGYPGGWREAYTMTGKLVDATNASEGKLCYNIDTEKGQSGSGICFTNSGKPPEKLPQTFCIGVHTCAGSTQEAYNIGVLIDEEIKGKIDEFCPPDER